MNPETLGERISAGFRETVADISEGFEDFTVDFIVNLPYLLIWAVIIAVAALLVRSLVRRHKRNIAEKRVHASSADQATKDR